LGIGRWKARKMDFNF